MFYTILGTIYFLMAVGLLIAGVPNSVVPLVTLSTICVVGGEILRVIKAPQ